MSSLLLIQQQFKMLLLLFNICVKILLSSSSDGSRSRPELKEALFKSLERYNGDVKLLSGPYLRFPVVISADKKQNQPKSAGTKEEIINHDMTAQYFAVDKTGVFILH